MTPTQQKEEISKAYVAAVAAHCGYALGSWSQDQWGLDTTVGGAAPVGGGHLVRPKIDLQLKCTSDQSRVKNAHVSWQFETKQNHDRLVAPSSAPMFLVVMVLPEDPAAWMAHSARELIMRRSAFYKLMTNEPQATVASPTVQVPSANLFSPSSLELLMEQVSKGTLP